MNISFGANIVEKDGIKALVFNNEDYFQTRIQKLPVGKYRVTIDDKKPKRSTAQNNFLWGVVYPLIATETGNDVEDLHEYAKRKFIAPRFITVNGEIHKIPGSTTKLTKAEFAEYLMNLEAWSNVTLPDPEEAGYISNTSKTGNKYY